MSEERVPASMAWLWALAAVGGLLVLAGHPATWGLLGDADRARRAVWSLWYCSGRLWVDGLHTTALLYPDGGRVWPAALLEGVAMAPLTRLVGAEVAFNVLVVLRVAAAALGAALLLRDRGLSLHWGVAVGLCAGAWSGSVAWAPLAAWALLAGGRWRLAMASVLACTSPMTAVGAAVVLVVIEPARWRRLLAALALPALCWAAMAWTLVPGPALDVAGAQRLWEGGDLDLGAGSLLGAVGRGGLAWGSPLLPLALLGLRPGASTAERRGLVLAAVGALLALGPVLIPVDRAASLGGRQVPLPLLLVARLPPVRVAEHLADLGVVAMLGAALVLAHSFRHRLAPAWLGFLLVQGAPARSEVPELVLTEGPTLTWPPSPAGWWLVAQARTGASMTAGLTSPGPAVLLDLVGQPAWGLEDLRAWARGVGLDWIAIDPTDEHSEAAELSLVLGGTRAATAGTWRDVDLAAWDAVPAHPKGTRPTVPPDDDWGWRDPDLDGHFDPQLYPLATSRLWVLTSPDGMNWTRQEAPVAHSLSSLGLSTSPDGRLLLVTAVPQLTGDAAKRFDWSHGASVVALATRDLQTWGARRYATSRPLDLVDPQLDWVEGELRLTAWVRTGPTAVDPASLSGEHPVIQARLDDAGRFVPRVVWSAPWLADPVPLGEMMLATQVEPTSSGLVASVLIERQGRTAGRLDGLSVPHAWRDEGGWHMLAHAMTSSPPPVVRLDSDDGLKWSDPVVLDLPVANCESPVGARFQGEYVILCSERLRSSW